jgi:hypothetical protein
VAKTSFETLRQGEVSRRRRLIKLAGLVVVVFVSFAACVWFYVTQPLFTHPEPVNQTSVSPTRLEAHVRTISEGIFPRDFEQTEDLERVASYVREQFEKAHGAVSDQPFQVNGKTYRNVIASFGPESGEVIIVGAHYDSFGPNAAADDNASGVAGLIELAYLLGQHAPALRTELVAYTLEEPPFFRTSSMGSAMHASFLKQKGAKVKAMLSLEMIGYFSDAPDSQRFPTAVFSFMYPSRGNFIAVVGSVGEGMLVRKVKSAMRAASPLPVYSINAPSFVPGFDFSDHLNYWNAGYPALMITDTAFYRNTAYHTKQDTADRLDYQRMSMVVQKVYAAVLALSN